VLGKYVPERPPPNSFLRSNSFLRLGTAWRPYLSCDFFCNQLRGFQVGSDADKKHVVRAQLLSERYLDSHSFLRQTLLTSILQEIDCLFS
jgi:hypothetical protein